MVESMKKFFKFLFCTFSLVATGLGIYYLYKNVICKSESDDDFDDFDDFDDDFDDLDDEDSVEPETREYVPINLSNDKDDMTEETPAPYEAEGPSSEE